jgi:7,8-dihydroneopterin aldolase/epimerase/oxygenase
MEKESIVEVSLTKLSIKNAEFYSFHGVKSEERKLGGKYQVDLDMYYDATNATMDDDIKFALNYEDITTTIDEVINGKKYKLIETLANEILKTLFMNYKLILEANVRVRKINVPMRRVVDYVEVEQAMLRNDE